jgi:hypothetical protein
MNRIKQLTVLLFMHFCLNANAQIVENQAYEIGICGWETIICPFNGKAKIGAEVTTCRYPEVEQSGTGLKSPPMVYFNANWKVFKNSLGYYYIVHDSSGLYLEVNAAAPVKGSKLILGKPTGTGNQQWKILPAPSGYYILSKLGNDLYLTMRGGQLSMQEYSNAPDFCQIFSENLACPYVSVLEESGYTDISEILRNYRYKGMDKYDSIDIPNNFIKNNHLNIRIQERKPEITYIDEMYIVVNGTRINPRICSDKIRMNDNDYLTLEKDDSIVLDFELPAVSEIKSVKIYAKGYYVPSNNIVTNIDEHKKDK